MLSKSGVPHSFSLDVLLLLKAEMTVLVALFPPNGSTVSVLWKRGAGLFAVVSLASFSSLNKCQILYTHPPPNYSRREEVTFILRVFIEAAVFQALLQLLGVLLQRYYVKIA